MTVYPHQTNPPVRFVGLVSSVGQTTSLSTRVDIGWPAALDAGVQSSYEALDDQPDDLIYPQGRKEGRKPI